MLSKNVKFKQFVKFQNLEWFGKTHFSFCNSNFEQVWVRGLITYSRCKKCGSVAYITKVSTKQVLTNPPKNRPKQIPTSTLPTLEGYIPRAKLGLEPFERNDDRETYKFSNHCIDCGQWFRSHKKEDLCQSCSNTGNVESGLDYDKFYNDKNEVWQQGQLDEVNSRGGLPKPSIQSPKVEPSFQWIKNHIMFMVGRGCSSTEVRLELSEFKLPPTTKFSILAQLGVA